MPASSTSPDPSPLELVTSILDEIGKVIPPQFFRRLVGGIAPRGSASAPSASDMRDFRLKFVLDSCSLQGALRSHLKHGKSGVLEGVRAGFLRPIAPRQLDREIRRHMHEIAEDCGVSITAARALYREVATLIEFKPVSRVNIRRLKREMPNPEDAAFVALLLESDVLGVVTEEKAYASIPGVRAYTAADASRMVVCYRKQATVFVCSVPMVGMAWEFALQVVGALVKFVRQLPGLAVGVALAALAFAAMYPERARKALEETQVVCADLWALLGPYLMALATVAQIRIGEAEATRQRLEFVRLARA